MKLRELFEATSKEKHITFCFGRMNPPTIGHEQLLDTCASVGGDYKIFVSQTQDKKKNPLDYSTKIAFIKKMFPKHAPHVVEDTNLNTIGKVASYLYDQGYTHATIVGGSDRIEDLYKLLETYNGVEGKAHGYYKFETLDAKSSGDREDGAEGVAGISASGARAAAANGDIDAFAEATGAGKFVKELYDAVRKGMGLDMKAEEFIDEGKKDRRDKRHTTKPKAPNPVAKHAMSTIGGGGFGAHKDKKKAAKQGDTKHKGKVDEADMFEYETHTYKDSQGNVWRVNDEGDKELVSAAPGGGYGGGSRYGSRYPRRPAYNKPKGYYFYNVSAGQENDARAAGLRQSKNGKWFDTMTNPAAEKVFGKGRYWEPKN